MKVAILDDYLLRACAAASWSRLARRCEITVFDRPLQVPDEAAAVLRDFDIICLLRERMPVSRELIGRLPKLRMIAVTGLYCRVLDVAAAAERGIVVSFTELRGSYRMATSELAWGLMLSGTSQDFYSQAPWIILFPGIAISLAVFAFNLFGDALRDYLDPRFKV